MGLCCGFRLGWRAIREEFAPSSSGNHPELLLPASRIVIAAFNFCLHLIGGQPESLLPIAHLSLPWSMAEKTYLSLFGWLFVRPAMVTLVQISLLVAPHPQTHTFSESL